MNRLRRTRTDSRYVAGFASALALLVAVALSAQAAKWLMTHPQPRALVGFLTAPLFSPLDAFMAVSGVLVLASIFVDPWRPRA